MPFCAIPPVSRTRSPDRDGRDGIPLAGLLGAGAALALVLGACASGSKGTWASVAPPEPCILLSGAPTEHAKLDGPVTIGLTRSVNPDHAPAPTNPDEAFLFGLLYEPLVRMDCTGRLVPGVASSWESDDGGRAWTFTLRNDALFHDGSPVTARHVADGWRRLEESGRSPWMGVRPLSVEVLDPRRLRVTFAGARAEPPAVLASHALAVAVPGVGETWPSLGTGPYRVDAEPGAPSIGASTASSADPSADPPADPSAGPHTDLSAEPSPGPAGDSVREIRLRPVRSAEEFHLPPLRVRVEPGADPRNLLGAGADLVVTSDPETREYAALRPDLTSRPLPWSRRYVLAVVREPGMEAPVSLLEELARDVVREEARASRTPVDGRCVAAYSPDAPSGSSMAPAADTTADHDPGPRIGFPRDDPTARALAERLVALAAAGRGVAEGGSVLRMLGLDEVPTGLRAAPFEPVSRPSSTVRSDAGSRRDAAVRSPWTTTPEIAPGEIARVLPLPLGADGGCGTIEMRTSTRNPPHLISLVETRERVFATTEAVRLAVDGFGTPFLVEGPR